MSAINCIKFNLLKPNSVCGTYVVTFCKCRPQWCSGNMPGCGVSYFRRIILYTIKLDNDFPEQVWCKLRYNGHHDILVGVCYRTPTEKVYGHIAHEQLRDLFLKISDRDFILMGDFKIITRE